MYVVLHSFVDKALNGKSCRFPHPHLSPVKRIDYPTTLVIAAFFVRQLLALLRYSDGTENVPRTHE